MKDIETPEEMLYKFFNKETEFWKNFANEELNDLKTAREKMQKIYNIKKQEIEAEEQVNEALKKFNEALKKFNDGLAKADETIEMLDEKYPYLKDTLPVKCETKSNTPFKDELAKYMMEYIEQIKNLRKNIKNIWNKNANNKQNNANEIAGK